MQIQKLNKWQFEIDIKNNWFKYIIILAALC